ncbi:peptide MFS transporter [Litoribaculum gwangyangense]|uniref:Peptide MFS transporter n=1 Tax=Litoribaculum gwangyangense TaxID=1130722 RepID=A0ABP9CPP2_9FLAO
MADNVTTKQKELFGHPIGLYVLFFTEMWERFSFYGMKALLIYYLVKYHLFDVDHGNLLVGSYAAMVYATPVIGGYLADKYLGFRKAVIFGGILLVLGHLGMVFEGNQAQILDGVLQQDNQALQIFYFSLSLIIVGVGFLKANISSIVGELYDKNDIRKDSAFTIFYMGINLGSFLATLICGWLGETYGWGYGFGAAGIGMVLGLLTFIFGRKFLNDKGEPPSLELLNEKHFGLKKEWIIYIMSLLSLFVIQFIVQRHEWVEKILTLSLVASLIFIILNVIKLDTVSRGRLIALTILSLFSIIFWALFEQAYTSLNLFASVTDCNILGIQLKPTQFLSFNAFFIFTIGPIFAWLWVKLGKYNPNTVVKFALALIFVGLGFGVLVFGANSTADGMKVAGIWLLLCYLLHTIGELCLSPVGLSAVTKLAPTKIVGFMMGFWFLATAFSEYIAGVLANIANIETSNGEITDTTQAISQYTVLFDKLFWVGLICGIILLLASPLIKKLMHGIK